MDRFSVPYSKWYQTCIEYKLAFQIRCLLWVQIKFKTVKYFSAIHASITIWFSPFNKIGLSISVCIKIWNFTTACTIAEMKSSNLRRRDSICLVKSLWKVGATAALQNWLIDQNVFNKMGKIFARKNSTRHCLSEVYSIWLTKLWWQVGATNFIVYDLI